MGLLTIAVTAAEDSPVLVLSGEADMTTAAELTTAVAAQVDAGARHVTLDLSGLRFADSATFGVLIWASRALRARGGTLALSRPQPAVARVMTLLGVDRMIPVLGPASTGPDGS